MGFLDIGFGEILMVLVLAVIIWGPGRVVEIGRTLGKMVYKLKKATLDLTSQISSETEGPDKKPPPQ